MSTIGVDVGGTKVSAAVLEDGELSEPSVEPTEKATADTLVDQLARRIEELRGPGTEAVGLGIPAAVEFSTGAAKSGVNNATRASTKPNNRRDAANAGSDREHHEVLGHQPAALVRLG